MLSFKFSKGTTIKTLIEKQRNVSGEVILPGEKVRVSRSKEDPFLIDIISVKKPKRIIRNVPVDCVDSNSVHENCTLPENEVLNLLP